MALAPKSPFYHLASSPGPVPGPQGLGWCLCLSRQVQGHSVSWVGWEGPGFLLVDMGPSPPIPWGLLAPSLLLTSAQCQGPNLG